MATIKNLLDLLRMANTLHRTPLLLSAALLLLIANVQTRAGNGDLVLQPLHTKCLLIKKELTSPNLNVIYKRRPRRYRYPPIWLLRWQKVYIPIPRKRYKTLILFGYHKSVRKYASAPGFILLAQDGTAVIATHYFKTLKYVYTNGLHFTHAFPVPLKRHFVVTDLHRPEFTTSKQVDMFSYHPSDLKCHKLNKYKRTVITALLMVKLDYSQGTLLSAYKGMGKYSGWVSKERIQLKTNRGLAAYPLHKGFYSQLLSRDVINHVRIYTPAGSDIKNLTLALGYYNKQGYQSRPEWLYQLEKVLYRNTAHNRIGFLNSLKASGFDSLSLRSAARYHER